LPSDRLTFDLATLNAATAEQFVALLEGIYEHSPWVARGASAWRPYASLPTLKLGLVRAVREASADQQLGLIRAHPELAGKAMVAGALTAESTSEQSRAGLTHCTPEEFARLQKLNADYNQRFGFPFILAVRGPRGTGLNRAQIIAAFERRLSNPPDYEQAEALRNIHRIAEVRLDERFAQEPALGNRVLDLAESLARFSDPGFAERGELTVTYLTQAHQGCAAQLTEWMRAAGFDEVTGDAVGNVVARYHAADESAPYLLTGSHFDTVRNGGRYDGRLGIVVPLMCVERLHAQRRRLPYGIELVAFAEEEGQRYRATFLGSGALTGAFQPEWLEQRDAQGISMAQAMRDVGLSADLAQIHALRRDPSRYLGFVEVHIEQGPVLNELDLPLGVVTSINGSVRYLAQMIGMASHAGTTPMDRRRDALAALAELAVYVEKRASSVPDVVATIGQCEVPAGSINVVPGRCRFSLDIRATTDAARDACAQDILAELARICERRGTRCQPELAMRAAAAPCAPDWQQRWADAVQSLGLPVYHMPSGAGHDAMMLHTIMPQGMLFMRGLNGGISHNPLEAITNHDAELVVRAFDHLLAQLAESQPIRHGA
jgi:N-carbamoyl-L-amino-acid hydrolase